MHCQTTTLPVRRIAAALIVAALPGAAWAQDIAASALPHDLSPWGMFLAADIVVKAVMIGLAIASVVTWTVALFKLFEVLSARRGASLSHRRIAAAGSLAAAGQAVEGRRDPVARMLRAAGREVIAARPTLHATGLSGVKERVASALSRIEAAAGRDLAAGTGLLATIGSTAPFVGLFGTVWGIMNAFVGISRAQTTNLAVVAPGIAEALLATALGLVAAIPAVVIYNLCARATATHRANLRDSAALIERLVSRSLDHSIAAGGR